MDIEKLIERECKNRHEDNDSGVHDRAYQQALKRSYNHYKDMSLGKLEMCLEIARDQFKTEFSNHRSVANCMVIYELIKEF